MKRVLSIPYTFTLMNWAALAGLYCFVAGREVWTEREKRCQKPRSGSGCLAAETQEPGGKAPGKRG